MSDTIRRLVNGVLLQRKLLRDMKGVTHLALTWSFVALLLGSVVVQLDSVLLAPLHAGLARGGAWQVLQAALDIVGAVLLAAATLALWLQLRQRQRPDRMLALGALMLLAATGFLQEGLRLAMVQHPFDRSALVGRLVAAVLLRLPLNLALVTRVVWWLHLTLALAFLAAFPWTFLRHALLAPVVVAQTSPLPHAATPLPFDLRDLIATGRFDVPVGLAKRADLDTPQRLALASCVQCQRCTAACPVHKAGSTLAPSELIAGLVVTVMERSDESITVLASPELWACAQCGACDEACPVHVHPRDLVLALRRNSVASGHPEPAVAGVLRQLGRAGNPYGQPAYRRAELADKMAALGAQNPADGLAYWLGCAASFDTRVAQVALATAELLRRAGVGFVVLGAREACCGEPARRLGEEGRFQELALQNIAHLQELGARRVVTHCAHCHHVLGRDYPQLGADLQVVHHAALLAELLDAGRLRPSPVAQTWTQHDACHMGRIQQQFAPPRRVLQGAELVEMARPQSACCGGGGGRAFTGIAEPEPPALLRLRQAKATGATILATECPFCLRMFDEATAREPGMRVADIAELLLERCVLPESGGDIPC